MKKQLAIAMFCLSLAAAPATVLACACQGNQYRTGNGPVSLEEAQAITVNYLASIDNGNLRPGNVTLDGSTYVVDVFDESGNAVATLNINMYDGSIQPRF